MAIGCGNVKVLCWTLCSWGSSAFQGLENSRFNEMRGMKDALFHVE